MTGRKQNWWRKYFISYLFVGVLPAVILGIVFYFANITKLKAEVKANSYATLTQSLHQLDYYVEKMNGIAYHISGQPFDDNLSVSEMRRLNTFDDDAICRQLQVYEDTLDLPANVILYIRGDANIYTSSGKLAYAAYEESQISFSNLTMSRFYSIIGRISSNTSVSLVNSSLVKSGNTTAYLYPIPQMASLPSATLCFILPSDTIANHFENFFGDEIFNLYLFNQQRKLIYFREFSPIPETHGESFSFMKGTGVFEDSSSNIDYVIMRNISQNSGFSIVVTAHAKDYYSKITLANTTVAITIAILILVAFLLSFIMSKRNYRPVQELVKQLPFSAFEQGETARKSSSEFELIESGIIDMQQQNQKLSEAIERQRPIVVSSCVSKLLRNKYNSRQDVDTDFAYANIRFAHPCFFVMLLRCPHEGASFWSENESDRILLLVESIDNPQYQMYCTEILTDKNVVILVNCIFQESEEHDIRRYIGSHVQSVITSGTGTAVSLCAGRLCHSPLETNLSFIEASALTQQGIAGDTVTLFEETAGSGYYYSEAHRALLAESLRQIDESAAISTVHQIFQHIHQTGSVCVERCLCYDIINLVIKTAYKMNCPLDDNDIAVLCSFESSASIMETILSTVKKICNNAQKLQTIEDSKLKNQIIDYVQAHYTDSKFGLEMMSDAFDLSSNYLSKYFKRETGRNFVSYITDLRMTKAKELLANTDMKVKDIAVAVGYIDIPGFVRRFKSCEGFTPGKYREAHRETNM